MEPPNSHATRGLTPCSPRATSIAHEHNRVDLRLLRLRPRQQPSFHGRGEKVRPNSGREPHPSGLWRRVGGPDGGARRIRPPSPPGPAAGATPRFFPIAGPTAPPPRYRISP